MNNIWILAQASDEGPAVITGEPVSEEQTTTITVASDPNAAAKQGPPPGPMARYGNLIFIGLMVLVFWMLLFRGPRKKQAEHKKMVQALQKNDRVRTIGGIYGTVIDIKDDEITLKVDESNNTKIKISPSAIGTTTLQDNS
ncbi:hypothetical protein ES708_03481 [subsurface metagenome]